MQWVVVYQQPTAKLIGVARRQDKVNSGVFNLVYVRRYHLQRPRVLKVVNCFQKFVSL